MITMKRFLFATHRWFEKIAIARVNSVLLGMGRNKVEEFGYSYDLLKQGPAAWPWRVSNQHGAEITGNVSTVLQLSALEEPVSRNKGLPTSETHSIPDISNKAQTAA